MVFTGGGEREEAGDSRSTSKRAKDRETCPRSHDACVRLLVTLFALVPCRVSVSVAVWELEEEKAAKQEG